MMTNFTKLCWSKRQQHNSRDCFGFKLASKLLDEAAAGAAEDEAPEPVTLSNASANDTFWTIMFTGRTGQASVANQTLSHFCHYSAARS